VPVSAAPFCARSNTTGRGSPSVPSDRCILNVPSHLPVKLTGVWAATAGASAARRRTTSFFMVGEMIQRSISACSRLYACPRGFAPGAPLHALSRAASPARSGRVARSQCSLAR
jgi:hypothetical protein